MSTSYTYVKFDAYDGYVPEAGLDGDIQPCSVIHTAPVFSLIPIPVGHARQHRPFLVYGAAADVVVAVYRLLHSEIVPVELLVV